MNITAIRSALSESDAAQARDILDNAEWRREKFVDPGYYGKVYQNPSIGIPNTNEIYSTDFYKWYNIYSSEPLMKIMGKVVDIIDSRLSGSNVKRDNVTLFGYKLGPGGHLRLHNDQYIADIGFIWYLSRDWKWDWGGLLLAVNDDGTASVEMPEYNKLILVDHSKTVTHCVTTVADWAGDDRMFIVGMMRLT